MIKYFTIALLLLPFYTFGQDTVMHKAFLDKAFEPCDSLSAKYIGRIYQKKGTTSAKLRIYTLQENLLIEADYSDFARGIKDGYKKEYRSGKLKLKAFYKNDKLDGEFTTYYPNEILKRKDIYKNDTLISGNCYTSQGQDTTYYNYIIQPQYLDGGVNTLRKRISEKIKYPKWARRNEIEGEVVISFIIGKDGIAQNFKVQKPVHTLLDSEALRVVSSIGGRWSPMYKDGQPEALKQTLPIAFKLGREEKKKK